MSPEVMLNKPIEQFEAHVAKYLSMVLHHESIQMFVRVALQVHAERSTTNHAKDPGGLRG